MKRKLDYRIPVIIILIIIFLIMFYVYLKSESEQNFDSSEYANDFASTDNETTQNTTSTTITANCEVQSNLSEKLEVHATYYLSESYIELNKVIKAGENILKYTNGKYLQAPYDCVITESNIPDVDEKCTNEHYIKIESINNLMVQFEVDETEISNVTLGQNAIIKLETFEDKSLQGNVINISNTASNGKFTVTVQFDNDGDIMLGMTANVTIIN
ncbi:MAG: HlyD family secretion protein [Clostridia bacterium]|nr:HlyD family secretion protein [Clostridia bacterium]